MNFQLLFPLDRDARFPDEAKKKFPKHLTPARPPNNKFTEKGFYTWNIPKPKGKLALFLFIGVLIAIAFMLFHLWPMWLKIGIWYFSFYTLIILVSLAYSQFSSIGWLHHAEIDRICVLVPFRS